jgi:Predicted nucleotide-binding protein containing TIR -like domain
MYYQILVETTVPSGTAKKNITIKEVDIVEKEEILNDILIPYLSNKDFVLDGYFLNKEKVRRLKITTTEKSAHYLSEYENAAMPESFIMHVSPKDILSYSKYNTDVTKQLTQEANGLIKTSGNNTKKANPAVDKTKVFIVHGHDNEAKLEVARFLEKLSIEAIILHEQVSAGMTIIEKIGEYSNVGYSIVLYTPCDVGYKKDNENKKNSRARQNVVFEHGYMIGKLGRTNVCALIKGNIETPNDIAGQVYTKMDSNNGWKLTLAKEMKNAGYNIDLNRL